MAVKSTDYTFHSSKGNYVEFSYWYTENQLPDNEINF